MLILQGGNFCSEKRQTGIILDHRDILNIIMVQTYYLAVIPMEASIKPQMNSKKISKFKQLFQSAAIQTTQQQAVYSSKRSSAFYPNGQLNSGSQNYLATNHYDFKFDKLPNNSSIQIPKTGPANKQNQTSESTSKILGKTLLKINALFEPVLQNISNSQKSPPPSVGIIKKKEPKVRQLKLNKSYCRQSEKVVSKPKRYNTPKAMSTSLEPKNFTNKNINYFRKVTKKNLSLDQFKMGKKLGNGRFGSVYQAVDKATNMAVAIKTMRISEIKAEKMEQQVIAEIKLQMYLQHPNILQMYGFFKEQQSIYLILELGEHCLFKEIREKGQLSEKSAADLARQTIEGVRYLHSQMIIHRDIKPQNLMVSLGVIKIGDFGWSVYSPLYKRKTFCGTLDYVPPEIVNREYYDEKVDIWSIGVLIYQLLTGEAPFESENSEEETFQKINSISLHIPPYLSINLKNLVQSILVKEPEERPNLMTVLESNWLKHFQKQNGSIDPAIWKYWIS